MNSVAVVTLIGVIGSISVALITRNAMITAQQIAGQAQHTNTKIGDVADDVAALEARDDKQQRIIRTQAATIRKLRAQLKACKESTWGT